MSLDLGRLISRALAVTWHHRWLWLLGVFGGAGAGYSFSSGAPNGRLSSRQGVTQLTHFVSDHLALILAAVAVVVVIALVAFVLSCVAVPASIWAGLELDAGREVRLGAAWLEGRARFWRYLRLALLKLAIGFGLLAVAGLVVAVGVGIYHVGGEATILLLVPAGVLLFVAVIAALVLIALGLTWSDRLLVILELGAVDALRAGWWLFRHSKLDTVVFGIVFYILRLLSGVLVALVAGLAALPGILLVIGYFNTNQAPAALLIAGSAWILLLGGGIELVGAGFIGALTQVGYAMAARDLSYSRGLIVAPA